MKKLMRRIAELEKISAELELTAARRRDYIQQVSDYAEAFIDRLAEAPAYSNDRVRKQKLSVGQTSKPEEFAELLSVYDRQVASPGIRAASAGHFGYIPGGGLFVSALADFLAALTNEYAGIYFSSPGAVTIEHELLNWLKTIFGFSENSVGNLASGGSIATLIAFTAARDRHRIRSNRISESVIYLSEQTHHCVDKALRIIGLDEAPVRHLPLDKNWRIDPALLARQIETDKKNGLRPFLIVASAGTTDTGAVDPLREIGRIAADHGIWYHIDAAYGGFFILTDEKRHLFDGIDLADSLIVDPHKGLFLPFGIGAVLVKDKGAVLHSNHYVANYMQDARGNDLPLNPSDVSPELTKHFRSLRMWLPLRLHGLEPFIACLEEKLLLTEYFRYRLREKGFQIGPEPDLSISYFWYQPELTDPDLFNQKLLEYIYRDGRAFLSSTVLDGKFVIRIAVLSFRTRKKDVDRALEMIVRAKDQCLRFFAEKADN